MKIRPPAPGRTTATLVSYEYSQRSKRTVPVRHGSFNLSTDPDALPQGINVPAGAQLNIAQLNEIRNFLLANRPAKYPAELVEQVRQDLLKEQAQAAKSAEPAPVAPPVPVPDLSPMEQLHAALAAFNEAATSVRTVYKTVPKGEAVPPETTHEFEKTWFSNQGMVNELKIRADESFYRPGGWTGLKAQIVDENRVWLAGEPVPELPKKGKAKGKPVADADQEGGAQ
jgi:hypothetical protein